MALAWRARARLRAGLRPSSTYRDTARRLVVVAAWMLVLLASGRIARNAAATVPTAAGIAAFAVIYGIVRAALAHYSLAARDGWLGALPVGRAARERSAGALASIAGLGSSLALVGVSAAAGGDADPLPIVATIAIGLAAAFAGWLATVPLRSTRASITRTGHATRARAAPRLAFAPTRPRSSAVPHVALWQRVRTAARWRSAGRAWQFGALALALPRNTAVLVGVALVVAVAATLWWLTMVAASLDVYREARRLLAALAHDRRALARAACRYPVLASASAAAILALAYTALRWPA